MSGDSKTLTIRLVGNSKSAERAMGATGTATKSLEQRLEKVSGKFKSVGAGLSRVGARMTVVSAAAAYFVVRAGADYVDSLNKIQVLSDANDRTMRRVSATLEGNADLYAKIGFTTGEAADGVVQLVKAGMSLDSAMKAVNGTMILARAGEMSVGDASNLVSKMLNTFGLKAEKAGMLANYLANAANISSADVTDLAESLKYIAPVAAASGISFKTINAMLAELSNKGIEASLAGTGIRNFLLSLQAPAGAGGKAIKALGVDVFDAQGKARPFKDVLGDIATAIEKVDDKTRKASLRAIFGKTGINAATVLLEGGVKGLNRYEKGVSKAGAASRLANSNSKGLAGTAKRLRAQFTSIAQSVYREFSPAVDDVLKKVAKFVGGFSKLSPGARKLIVIIGAIALAAGPVLLVLGTLAMLIGALISPVGLAVAAVAALIGIFGFALVKSQGFRDAIKSLGPLFGKLKDFVKSFVPILKDLAKQFMEAVGPALSDIGDLIKTELVPAFEKILPILKPILGFLLMMFGGAVIGVVKGFLQVIKGVVQVVAGVFSLIADLIHGDWHAVWHDLLNIVKGVFNILIGALRVWWNVGILSIFKRGFLSILGLFKGGWKGLLALGRNGIKGLNKVLGAVWRVLTSPFRAGFKAVTGYVKTGWKFITGRFSGGIGGIKGILGRLFQVMTYPYRVAWSAVKSIVSRGVAAVKQLFGAIPGKIKGALGKIKGVLTGIFSKAGGWLISSGEAIIKGLVRGITNMGDNVKDAVKGVLSKARNLLPFSPAKEGPFSGKGWTLYSGQAIAQSLADGIGSKVRTVQKAAAGLASAAHPGTGGVLAGFGSSAGVVPSGGYLRGSAGAQPVYVYVTVEGNVIGEKDFAKRVTPTVRDELTKIGNRNGGRIF